MPRTKIHQTERNLKSISTYERAYEQVLGGQSVRGAAKEFGLCHVSLMRYKRKREAEAENTHQVISMGYNSHTTVFSPNQEIEMSKYIMKAADIYFGLSSKEIRRLAYELAEKYHLKAPSSWATNKKAGKVWFPGFMERQGFIHKPGIVTTATPVPVKNSRAVGELPKIPNPTENEMNIDTSRNKNKS
ncbi:hypothetical protein JTB14_035223 [Gonioctena quinquepunctata]|nr:hypothetical protein JTB14_035223 [Gonioctena quinquepunctata]